MIQANNFDLLSSLPAIFFAICFFINFLIFSWGGILLLIAKGDAVGIEKGKKVFSLGFTVLFIILLLMAVFFIISYLLQEGEVFQASSQASEEFPPSSHLGVFPDAPEYIDIGKYHFTGPFEVNLKEKIGESAIYSILCKKDDKYDILYINNDVKNAPAKNDQYSCWINNCGGSSKNIYIAIFWTPSDNYDTLEKEAIKQELIEGENPICKDAEAESD